MAINRQSTLPDVCFAVCSALDRAGTTVVLTGGSAATVYAPTVYQSGDADFVITMHADDHGAEILANLGYRRKGQTYEHEDNPYTLEFPRGPLAVGDDLISSWETLRRDDEILHILSRTDSVRDRLMWFYLDDDRGPVDLAKIRNWSVREGFPDRFEDFFSRLTE